MLTFVHHLTQPDHMFVKNGETLRHAYTEASVHAFDLPILVVSLTTCQHAQIIQYLPPEHLVQGC